MIHVSFLIEPTQSSNVLEELGHTLLNDAERSRLLRYTRTDSKRQLLLSRWLVHEQLARSFPDLPHSWKLASDMKGRPIAVHSELDNEINYSLSHCDGLIVCAVSDSAAIGIDAEPKNQPIKDSFLNVGFTALEQQQIRNSSADSLDEMRLRWTIKESLGKMTGQVGFESIVEFCTGAMSYLDPLSFVFVEAYGAWLYCLPFSNGHFITLVVAQDRLLPPEIETYDLT